MRRSPLRSLISHLLFIFSVLGAGSSVAAAQRTDVLRGRVIGTDSMPLANAIVTAVDTAAKLSKPTRTDSSGRFTLSFENGNGTYLVSATMLGHAPQRRVVARQADGSIAPVNFMLSTVAAQLGAVKTVGERPKTARTDANGDYSVGGTTTYANLSNGLTGDVTGDLTAVLATMPGIAVTPSATGGTPTISAFGIGSDQNGLVLNGMGFGAQVPRDGFRLAVVSSSYDPSRGGFAGVQLSLRMQPGNNISSWGIHGTLDSPSLQVTTPVAERLGTRYDQEIVSGALSGPIVYDKLFYAGSYQVTRHSNNLTSLASADPASLEALHVDPDSVSRLFGLLQPEGIPVTTSRVPDSRLSTEGRFAARFDFVPNMPPSNPGQFFLNNATYDDYYLEVGGTLRSNGGTSIGVTSVPSFGGEQGHRDGWFQFTAAKYLPRNILNEASVSFNGSDDQSSPYLDLPSARILIASGLGDGSVGLSPVQVGGSSSPHSDNRNWSGELRDQLLWNTWDRRHAFSLTFDGTRDGYAIQQDASFGSFSFNSLSDFSNDVPASYSRTLTARHTSGAGYTGAIGLGDTYNPTPPGSVPPGTLPPSRPTVQYGVRLETNGYDFRPEYNGAVDSVFHLRTDYVPSAVRVMPMVGFTWPIFPELRLGNGINFGRRGSISGGVREYRGSLPTRSLDGYVRQTGLPDAIQQLYCVGSAAPTPDWHAYEASSASIPTECANGASSLDLSQTVPQVSLFAPGYQLYDSWRPALNLNYTATEHIRLSLNGTYALNRNIPAQFDVNFNPTVRLTLPDEGNRPVYVSATSIIPSTGTEAFTESRVSQLFAHVAEQRSDLHGETRTLGATLNYSPAIVRPNDSYTFESISYAFNDAREQTYGFGGTSAGNPTQASWSRGAIARQVITASFTGVQPHWGSVGLQARLQSGLPFTPLVAGDVNGDGYSNDRAFVFNPATAKDSSVASTMAQLLRSAPSNTRDCLQRQLGTVAGRNSCTGPWSMPLLNLSISPDPYRFGFRNRGSVQLLVTNVLSGLDQALHGADKLHGWGQFAYPDPTLLTVRGYDPTANRFQYTVNPLFGSTAQYRSTFRTPFLLTLDARVDVGPDRETQYLDGLLRVRSGDGPLTEQQVKGRIARGFNPLDQILLVKDSLKLTTAQVDSMAAISKRYSTRRDSIVTSLARFLVARRGDYGGEEVRRVWHDAGIASYRAYLSEARQAIALLTPEQRERSKTVPQLQGFLTIESISDSDVPSMFRGALAGLP